jgi:hypothetical protein
VLTRYHRALVELSADRLAELSAHDAVHETADPEVIVVEQHVLGTARATGRLGTLVVAPGEEAGNSPS